MPVPLFGRHRAEFARAFRDRAWERTPEGVFFPRQGALLAGEFAVTSKYGVQRQHNLVLDWGLEALGALVQGGALTPLTYYIAPFGFDETPLPDWFAIDVYFAGELGNAPQGYDEAARQLWVVADEGAKVIGNTASPAAFTLRALTTIEVYGFALMSVSVKRNEQPTTPFDVTPVDEFLVGDVRSTPYGLIRVGFDSTIPAPVAWLDPSSDDFFDSGSGMWVDPNVDALELPVGSITRAGPWFSGNVFAAARFDSAPLVFANLDPLNVTYTVQLR